VGKFSAGTVYREQFILILHVFIYIFMLKNTTFALLLQMLFLCTFQAFILTHFSKEIRV